jgi:hypothetical protein
VDTKVFRRMQLLPVSHADLSETWGFRPVARDILPYLPIEQILKRILRSPENFVREFDILSWLGVIAGLGVPSTLDVAREREVQRAKASRELECRLADAWFGGALSAATTNYRWTDIEPSAPRPLLTAEGAAISLRIWSGLVDAVEGQAVGLFVPPHQLSEAWDDRPLGFASLVIILGPGVLPELVVDARAALLLFVVGVLVALRLILVRALFVLSRMACAVAVGLLLVAVRLRCGCRTEPDDCAFSLSCQYQTWSGSAPAVS